MAGGRASTVVVGCTADIVFVLPNVQLVLHLHQQVQIFCPGLKIFPLVGMTALGPQIRSLVVYVPFKREGNNAADLLISNPQQGSDATT